jgi:hypothetical protein
MSAFALTREERPLGRVSKDAPIVPMVRDSAPDSASALPGERLLTMRVHPLRATTRWRCILHRRHHPRKRMIQYSVTVLFNFGVTAYWTPAAACRRDRRRRDPMAGMTALPISTSLRVYQESCVLHQPMQPAAPWFGPRPASADIRRDLFRVLPIRRQG